ncbi:MAG: hypothetical protein IJA72_00010 [Clostridia bacterium]|nr:hypothetical protein [Clostridia bacterium]
MKLSPNLNALNNEMILITSLLKWRETPNKSLRVIFKQLYKSCYPDADISNSRELLNKTIETTTTSLTMQSFTYCYEFLRNNIDDKMPAKLKNMRNKLSSNTSNLNTVKFLDTIRQSFAHNDITAETPNWRFNDNYNLEINFKGQNFVFEDDELRLLMNEFLKLKKKHFPKLITVHQDLPDIVEKGKLTKNNINRYITQYTDRKVESFDKYQCNAIYNLICPNNNNSVNRDNLEYLLDNDYFNLTNFLPFKQHAGMLASKMNMSIRLLIILMQAVENRGLFVLVAKTLEKEIDLVDSNGCNNSNVRTDIIDYILNDTILFEYYLTSNALFNMFSMYTSEQLKPYFPDVDIRRLRNSIIHGRYYCNFKNGFEFYDGINSSNLEHIATVNINSILDSISELINNNVSHISTHEI